MKNLMQSSFIVLQISFVLKSWCWVNGDKWPLYQVLCDTVVWVWYEETQLMLITFPFVDRQQSNWI